jgi:hypothetical protein
MSRAGSTSGEPLATHRERRYMELTGVGFAGKSTI